MFNVTKRLAAIAGTVTFVSACGSHPAINATQTARYVRDVVFQQTGFRAVDVRCPSSVPAAPGGRFNCHFTGPEGPYTAYLRIMKVQGHRSAFQLKTQPSSWPPPTLR